MPLLTQRLVRFVRADTVDPSDQAAFTSQRAAHKIIFTFKSLLPGRLSLQQIPLRNLLSVRQPQRRVSDSNHCFQRTFFVSRGLKSRSNFRLISSLVTVEPALRFAAGRREYRRSSDVQLFFASFLLFSSHFSSTPQPTSGMC